MVTPPGVFHRYRNIFLFFILQDRIFDLIIAKAKKEMKEPRISASETESRGKDMKHLIFFCIHNYFSVFAITFFNVMFNSYPRYLNLPQAISISRGKEFKSSFKICSFLKKKSVSLFSFPIGKLLCS